MSPSPNFYHQEIAGNLFSIIREYLRRNPIGKVIIAPSDVEFDKDNVYQPDVFYIRNERLNIVDKHGAKGAPDIVAEVLSGGTGRLDRGPKKTVFAENGVIEYWMLDPDAQVIEVYRLPESSTTPAMRLRAGDVLETPLLPGLKIGVDEVFAH